MDILSRARELGRDLCATVVVEKGESRWVDTPHSSSDYRHDVGGVSTDRHGSDLGSDGYFIDEPDKTEPNTKRREQARKDIKIFYPELQSHYDKLQEDQDKLRFYHFFRKKEIKEQLQKTKMYLDSFKEVE